MNAQMRTRSLAGIVAFLMITLSQPAATPAATQQPDTLVPGPSFREVLSLRGVGLARISPDGQTIAYPVRSTDWEKNDFDLELWLAREGEEPFQLTRTEEGSSSRPRWSPDGRWLAFLARRGEKTQVQLIRPAGGEARPLTDHEEGVNAFEWSPDGRRIAFTATDPVSEKMEAREEEYGKYAVEDTAFRMTHLWVIDVEGEEEARRLTSDSEFTVDDFAWSPDGKTIAFDHRDDPRINSWPTADISLVDVESGEVTPLVSEPGPDGGPIWSPDGRWVLFSTALQDTAFYRNQELARIPASGGSIEVLTRDFDENPAAFAWTGEGIWFLADQGTERRIFRFDPEDGRIQPWGSEPEIIWWAHMSAGGDAIAYSGAAPEMLEEIYRTPTRNFQPQRITDMTEQTQGWSLGTRELIRWTSRDGTQIEGVLYKPEGFDAERPRPLLVIIHGGPTAVSRPQLVSRYVYPVTQWLAKGALVLMPNYRGSTGYGEEFRALNVRNLGVGDAWDVLSGVEHLVERGIAHPDSLGAMGWSQGGYISAFLTTTSDVFRAISVGAGISDWMTYYVNTDIHLFTRTYLKATPWEDPEIYARTSPITYIRDASTPTLIQHGENDARVPIPNAYELYQGLQDQGVEAKLIVYRDFGHGITRPKERLAANWHNWIWFARYVWGEELELPIPEEGEVEGEVAGTGGG